MQIRWVWLVALIAGCATDPEGPADDDGDGFTVEVDCDDGEPAIHPGATERCDGVDENCDGAGDDGAIDRIQFFADLDGDGAGDPTAAAWACEAPADFVVVAGDCDDADAARFPGATETCDGVDQDCDGTRDDDATDAATFFVDADGDSFGSAVTVLACERPLGTSEATGDCDDAEDDVFPGAVERCDGVDEDCDLVADDGAADMLEFYDDADHDGFGAALAATLACSAPNDTVTDATDCDDTDGDTWPGAPETCDGEDDDCDVLVDEDAVDAARWFLDGDGDGHGWLGSWVDTCEAPAGHLADATDCDDWNAANFPGADERCDGVDNNCDLAVDGADAIDPGLFFADDDGDGIGDAGDAVEGCAAPAGYVGAVGDCDDGDDAVSPLATELCGDGVDNDCFGGVDDCGAVAGPILVSNADAVWYGYDDDLLGYDVTLLDHDGDGSDDLVIGGPGRTNVVNLAGVTWMVYGGATLSAAGAMDDVADATFENGPGQDHLGWFLADLGDMDGDGFAELGIAAYSWDTDDGAAYVAYGGAARHVGAAPVAAKASRVEGINDDQLGMGLTGIGDFDGDGYDDAAMGAPYQQLTEDEGSVYLLFGSSSRLAATVEASTLPRVQGPADDNLCFSRCITADDYDGDGLSDVLMAGHNQDAYGSGYVLYGDPAGLPGVTPAGSLPVIRDLDAGSTFGWSVTSPGDFDGDGYADFFIGDFTSTLYGGSGNARLFLGGSELVGIISSDTAALAIIGDGVSALGVELEGLGDVDGDGLAEVAVGLTQDDGTVAEAGAVGVFAGGAVGVLEPADASWTLLGDYGGSSFGAAVASGDVDGDGELDLVVGAPNAGVDTGRVYIFLSPF